MGQILSQSEVEAILAAVDFTNHVPAAPGGPSDSPLAVSLYDFEHPEPLRRSQLDALRRLALANRDELEARLKGLLRAAVRVTFLSVEQSTFRDYLTTSEQPGCLVVLESPASPQIWLLDVGRSLAMIALDCILGGQANADHQAVDTVRPFTELEVKLLKKAFVTILPGLTCGLAPKDLLSPTQIVSDTSMRAEATSNDAVALVSYEIACGTYQGLMQLCVPWRFATHESAKLVHQTFDAAEPLRAGAGQLPVKVTARVAQFKLSASDLASLQRGDVVMTDMSPDDEIQLEINGSEVFRGTPGQNRNRKAIVLTTPIRPASKTIDREAMPPQNGPR